jgi:hypothetical protein
MPRRLAVSLLLLVALAGGVVAGDLSRDARAQQPGTTVPVPPRPLPPLPPPTPVKLDRMAVTLLVAARATLTGEHLADCVGT